MNTTGIFLIILVFIILAIIGIGIAYVVLSESTWNKINIFRKKEVKQDQKNINEIIKKNELDDKKLANDLEKKEMDDLEKKLMDDEIKKEIIYRRMSSKCALDSKPCRSYADCDMGMGYCNTCKGGGKCCAKTGGNAGCKNAERQKQRKKRKQKKQTNQTKQRKQTNQTKQRKQRKQRKQKNNPEGFNLMGKTDYFSYV